MSYDLMINGALPPAARGTVQAALSGADYELIAGRGDTVATLGFSSGTTDRAVAAAYKRCVAIARKHGLSIYDPQTGDVVDLARPGRHPPGWTPLFTPSQIRKLCREGRYPELLAQLSRIPDANITHRDGVCVFTDLLTSGDQRDHVNIRRDSLSPLQRVGVAVLKRGADPLADCASGLAPFDWAVHHNLVRVVKAMLTHLDTSSLSEALTRPRGGASAIERSVSWRCRANGYTTKAGPMERALQEAMDAL